jgi:DNA-binding CsgD family transcriptional regulator
MPRLTASDARRVQEIETYLGTFILDSPPSLESLMEPLRELLGTEKTLSYVLRPRDQGLSVEALFGARFPVRFGSVFDRWLIGRSIDFAAYHPIRPERWQRNVVFSMEDLKRRGAMPPEGTSLVRELWPQAGLLGQDQLRVLVCDGPSLLAWVGAYQTEPFDVRQRRLLAALVRPLRSRLLLERQVGAMGSTRAALDAALEALGRAAFVVGASGEIRHANAAGRALVDAQRPRVTRSLADAVRRRPTEMPFELTPLRTHGTPAGYLAVANLDTGEDARAGRAASAAARWRLTPRQGEILEHIANGLTNRTIAACLGVSERAVELHVSAIFDRAGVESRAALVAKLLDVR